MYIVLVPSYNIFSFTQKLCVYNITYIRYIVTNKCIHTTMYVSTCQPLCYPRFQIECTTLSVKPKQPLGRYATKFEIVFTTYCMPFDPRINYGTNSYFFSIGRACAKHRTPEWRRTHTVFFVETTWHEPEKYSHSRSNSSLRSPPLKLNFSK